MGDRYHYDRHGNYTGKSSENPPGPNIGNLILGAIVCFYGGIWLLGKALDNISWVIGIGLVIWWFAEKQNEN